MNIFTDYHHSGLLYSFHLLFEKRLGHRIYRPIGMEWFDKGFWNIAKPYGNNIETVKQFLSMRDTQSLNGSPPLNTIVGRNPMHPFYRVYDSYHDYEQKALSFMQFLEMDIDIIIASIPDHWATYKRLRDQFKPKAKLICHMGNMFNEISEKMHDGTVDNLMASTIAFPHPTFVNSAFYYQEQPLVEFKPTLTTNKKITSFAHVLPKKEMYEQYKNALPEFEFKAFGATCPDGWMKSILELYKTMQDSMFVWHVKPGGDGYGWNWHSAFLTGRPILTTFSDYKDKLGGLLFEDGITGVDLEKRPFDDNIKYIKDIVTNNQLQIMQEECRKRFDKYVNYDNEQTKVKTFLENLH